LLTEGEILEDEFPARAEPEKSAAMLTVRSRSMEASDPAGPGPIVNDSRRNAIVARHRVGAMGSRCDESGTKMVTKNA